jgi:hypothetical protein
VIVFSVQTLRNARRREAIRDVGLLVWDEAHHCVSPTYRAISGHFGDAQQVGFTATPERGDGQSLAPDWERVAYTRDVSWMVRHRWLIPPTGKAVEVPDLDLTKVKRTGGDYRDGELGDALADSLAPGLVAKAWLQHARLTDQTCQACRDAAVSDLWKAEVKPFWPTSCPDRCAGTMAPSWRKTIAFFPTVASCYTFAEAFQAAGVDARVVHGGLPPEERKALLAGHRAGVFPVLVNCMILTEGYDDPTIQCVLMGRPTRSRGLHMQIVGRGLRVDPARPYDGQDCLLLYVVGGAPIPELRTMADLSSRDVVMRDGRTLVELEDEFDAGMGVEPDAPVYYHGEVVTRDFDPLARKSSKVWIRTKGGSFFVPAGKHAYVFICEWPEPGRWSVCWAGKSHLTRFQPGVDEVPRLAATGRTVGMTTHRGLPLDQAMVWAEDLAADMGDGTVNLTDKRASWRRGVPSEKTMALARTLGIEPDGKKAGKVSDEIGIVLGSQRIDPLVKGMTR